MLFWKAEYAFFDFFGRRQIEAKENGILWKLFLLQVILIGLNAVFASAEIAVISMNDTKLERMAKDGDARAKRLAALTAQPTKIFINNTGGNYISRAAWLCVCGRKFCRHAGAGNTENGY